MWPVPSAWRSKAENAAGEIFNIGSGRAWSIAEVAERLAAAMGRPDLKPEILGRYRAGDIRNCYADIGKARRLLGFEPRHGSTPTLGPFVDWVAGGAAEDRSAKMQAELESRGLVT
jgi:dTDP-L-rhamnose 4-epimerase